MADPVHATLFAYQVGFGDCFLLRLEYDAGPRRHVLIDFGTTSLPEGAAPDHMLQVARDIEAKCRDDGDGLDVVVATHRHADHISGFSTRADGTGSGDVIARLSPKVVIQPWTEAPGAPVDWTGPAGSSGGQAFAAHRESLAAMHRASAAALGFVARAGRSLAPSVAGQIAFIGEDNLSNVSAVRNLQAMSKRHEYVFHGCRLDLSAILPGVKVDVLGPPTLGQTETIRKQRAKDAAEFWQLAARRLDAAAPTDGGRPLFPGAEFQPANKMLTEYRWLQRRIDETNGELALSLVRALDKQMNNTSVIMVMRAGSKTLLFPGDAQLENWQYALENELAPLLEDVDVYKVGHHGSLNATPRSMWGRLRKRGPGSRRDRLTSVVSTKHGKHGSEKTHTEVPRRTLMNELGALSDLHSTETMAAGDLFEAIEIPLT